MTKTETKIDVQEKFQRAAFAMKEALIERDEEIDIVLTAMLCQENPLLVGPPGTAKSFLIDCLLEWIDGARKFSVLVNKFTTPNEIFGPTDIDAYLKKEVTRLIGDMLPDVHFAFVDEIFKASTAILNTMLKILNERQFNNGKVTVKCPLIMCLSASNEWPNENNGGQELGALFDRFLFRKTVKPIQTKKGREGLWWATGLKPEFEETITTQEIKQAISEAATVEFTDVSKLRFADVIDALNTEGIFPGDRRMRKSVNACRAYAYLNGASYVQPEHLDILAHILWDDPQEQPAKAAKIVSRVANPVVFNINEKLIMAQDVVKTSPPGDAVPKLKSIQDELKAMPEHPKLKLAVRTVAGMIKEQYALVIGTDTDDSDEGE